ncbi:hypothetical protein HDU83_008344 [Entophlyctis luteolus]|nr:hypothetical protein HDU82_005766 [Entophlyctis luteolus]KAJ3352066.1 hypothetical protein HDU83_008344 [Entophlyctis luteolus]KAJ3384795.1 hypothetical protein HDU84_002634 [Entophlyctis sp. JEL0112]
MRYTDRGIVYVITGSVGAFLSAIVLYALLADNGRLLESRLERSILLLVGTCFGWSFLTAIRLIIALNGFSPTETLVQVEGAIVYISLAWLIGSHVVLALSRYFAFSEKSEHQTAKFFIPVFVYFGLVSVAVAVVYGVAPPELTSYLLEIPPGTANAAAYNAWVCIVSVTGLGSILGIVAVYYFTYKQVQKRLQQTAVSAPVGHADFRVQLERTVFWKCVAMAATTFVCYLPALVVLVYTTAANIDSVPDWIDFVESEFYLIDCVLTPLLVLYFMQTIRARVAVFFLNLFPANHEHGRSTLKEVPEFHEM